MEMDLKNMLHYVILNNMNVPDSVQYIKSRLGEYSISEKEMQYWYNFYHGISQAGRRCRCSGAHSMPRSICSSMLYCCENPFELQSRKLIVGENVPNLISEWNISYQADFFGAFYTRSERDRCCTLDGRYVVQCCVNLSSVKLIDLFHKKTTNLEYRDSKLALLARTRLSQKGAIKICDFHAIGPRRAVLLIRSNDYFENLHRTQRANAPRSYASAICLTEINIERGTFKFIDACIIEDHDVVLYNSYDRFPTLIGSEFKENRQLALIVSKTNQQAILRFHILEDRLKMGNVVEVLPHAQNDQNAGNVIVDDDEIFAHQIILMPRLGGVNRNPILQLNLLDEMAQHRRRRRQISLVMQTCINNKFYGFECKVQHNNGVNVYGSFKHVKLLLGHIHVFDLEERTWDDLQLETPFNDDKLNILNYHTLIWQWVGNKLFASAELEPNRTFIILFDLDTLKWSKMSYYFLDQVFSIVPNYNGDILVETRHKIIYGNRNDPLRRHNNQEQENEIQEDLKSYCFYRLNIGQPQSLLNMSYLSCRNVKEQHPESNVAKILDKMILRESLAPLPKLKDIPVSKPQPRQTRRHQALAARFLPHVRRRPVAEIPPLRRSERLRRNQPQRQNP